MVDNLFDYGKEAIKEQTPQLDKKQVMDTYNKYKDYSPDQLMEEFKKITKEKKQSGALNNNMIFDMAEKLKTVLTPEQQKNLDKVLKSIDD